MSLRDLQRAECAGALRVNAALGNHLAIEVRELFEQPYVLQDDRAAHAGRHRILVIGDGAPAALVSFCSDMRDSWMVFVQNGLGEKRGKAMLKA